jgi:CMP-N,N'-diacetyllegionaminic acid synthase
VKTVALVPCKGRSERLPRKNLLEVGGYTLVERAVHSAAGDGKGPPPVDLLVLASDDPAIIATGLRMAERLNVRAVGFELSEDLVGKRTPMEDVIAAVVDRHPADRYLLLQPTSPLRQRRHVGSMLAIMDQTGCDSVVAVHESTKEVYFSGVGFREESDGRDEPLRFKPMRPPGQRLFTNDLAKSYTENGAGYLFTASHWAKTRNRMGGDCRMMEMLPEDAIDIDTPAELERAQRWWGGPVT